MSHLALRFALLLLAPVALAAAEHAPTVVLISMDGLPAEYFDDARVEMPTLRTLSRLGARAQRMLPVFPTVTWPNHTSMVTGVMPSRHGVIANRYYDRAKHQDVDLLWDPVFDKEDIVRVPTVYDLAHQAGLKTAGIAWPGSRNARHLDWQVPCVIDSALVARCTTPELLKELELLGISPTKKAEWNSVDVGGKALWDWMHTRLAKHVLTTHRPNLLLLHFDLIDALEHRNGRSSAEALWACGTADHLLREVVDAVAAAGLAERTTFVVVSDHGFRNYTKQINLNALLRDEKLVTVAGGNFVDERVHCLPGGGSAGLYILDEANRVKIARDLLPELKALEGIEAVLDAEALARLGQPSATADSRRPDIMVAAKEGYSFAGRVPGPAAVTAIAGVKGAHGHLPEPAALQAAFFAWGAAIKSGVVLPQIRNVDVAPTIAAIFGMKMPDVDGRVLTEILR